MDILEKLLSFEASLSGPFVHTVSNTEIFKVPVNTD